MVLGHSRLIWARFVMRQNLPTVLRCHVAAFEAIGGVPRGDPLRSDEDGSHRRRRDEQGKKTVPLIDRARHYGFHPRACRPYGQRHG